MLVDHYSIKTEENSSYWSKQINLFSLLMFTNLVSKQDCHNLRLFRITPASLEQFEKKNDMKRWTKKNGKSKKLRFFASFFTIAYFVFVHLKLLQFNLYVFQVFTFILKFFDNVL